MGASSGPRCRPITIAAGGVVTSSDALRFGGPEANGRAARTIRRRRTEQAAGVDPAQLQAAASLLDADRDKRDA